MVEALEPHRDKTHNIHPTPVVRYVQRDGVNCTDDITNSNIPPPVIAAQNGSDFDLTLFGILKSYVLRTSKNVMPYKLSHQRHDIVKSSTQSRNPRAAPCQVSR